MKTLFALFALFLLTLTAPAQISFMGSDLARERTNQLADVISVERHPYLLVTMTTEKCYDCGYSYAMVCGKENPGCNTPVAPVPHYIWLKSVSEALDFLEHNQDHQLVKLLRMQIVPVNQSEEIIKHPQPDKVDKLRHYKAGELKP